MTVKKREEIPPQPIGKGIVANLFWVIRYGTLQLCVAMSILLLGAIIIILLATTTFTCTDDGYKVIKESTSIEKLKGKQ